MIYDLANDFDRARFKERANHLFTQNKMVELKVAGVKRTIAQNAYLHLIFGWYAMETGYTREEVKQDIFKREVCRDIFAVQKNGRMVYRSTADLDPKEMTTAIERFRNHASSDLGIYLPAPNEAENLAAMEYQLKKFGIVEYI